MTSSNRLFDHAGRYDKNDMRRLLLEFPDQCAQAWNRQVPASSAKNIRHVCFCGMGGSAVGGDILKLIVERDARIPFTVHRDYGLPPFAGKETLVITASYSGNTEETLSAYREARKRHCRLLVVSSGGELLRMAESDGVPFARIPGGLPPRCAFGNLFFPAYRLLRQCNLVTTDIPRTLFSGLNRLAGLYSRPAGRGNKARELAAEFADRVPVVYAGAPFQPVLGRWKTQMAENGKHFFFLNVLPEMNHNEIMAWRHPAWFIKKTLLLFVVSGLDHPRVMKRTAVTRSLIGRSAGRTITLSAEGKDLFHQIFSLLVLGDWISFYLALANKEDPTEINEITKLKQKLSKSI